MKNYVKLSNWVKESELTITAVAEKLEIGRSSLYNLMQGQYPPGLALATRIEELTGVQARLWVVG